MGKNLNSNQKNKELKYKYYPFNMMFALYINNEMTKRKTSKSKGTVERNSFKQEIYEQLQDKTGIPVETLRSYYSGKSTPPINTKLDEYKMFASIFGCDLIDLLPDTPDKINLLNKMGFEEKNYNYLIYKGLSCSSLFDSSKATSLPYFKVLNYIIFEKKFMTEYEEFYEKLSKWSIIKKKSDEVKNMSFKDFSDFVNNLSNKNFSKFFTDNNIEPLEKMEDEIYSSFKRHIKSLMQQMLGN